MNPPAPATRPSLPPRAPALAPGVDQQTYRRAEGAALLGLGIQVVLAAVLGLMALWAETWTLGAAFFHVLGGLPIWVVLWMIYHQHRLERVEALEAEQLARRDAVAGAIFDEHADDLAAARRRLGNLYKYGLPVVSLALAAYLLALGLWLALWAWPRVRLGTPIAIDPIDLPGTGNYGFITAGLSAAAAFVAFITARYLAGMTRVREWQLLRGGASYLMGNVGAALLLLAGALGSQFGRSLLFAALGAVIPALMALVGVEIILSFLLSAYRPRQPGEVPRPAFDSRLLGWLTSPESLAKIVSDTINYQFGFEVSRSWFYQLLGRAITPLLALGLVVLLLMSCVVVVGAQEEGILTRGGKIVGEPLGPGLHFKLPWPLSDVRHYEVGRVHQVMVGSISSADAIDPTKAILWTNQHVKGKEEYLVTAPSTLGGGGGAAPEQRPPEGARGPATRPSDKAVAGTLIAAQVSVQYRIADLQQYVLSADDPERTLTALADRAVNAYFVTKTVDTLLGSGRLTAGAELRAAIQAEADRTKLGLKVVFVGLTGVHPPADKEVAAAFHKVVGAQQERQNLIQKAQQDATKTLATIAGSREAALEINAAIQVWEQLSAELAELRRAAAGDAAATNAKQAQVIAQEAEIDRLLTQSRGEGGALIAQARAYRWDRAITEQTKAQRFAAELAAYRKAPEYYKARQYLDVLGAGLENARKYIVASQQVQSPLFRIDLKDATTWDLSGLKK